MEVATTWFTTEDGGDGITRIWEPFVDPMIQANAWLVEGRTSDLLIDTCNGLSPLLPFVQARRADPQRPLATVITHAHMDHSGGLHEFDDRIGHEEEEAFVRTIDPLLLAAQVWPAASAQMAEAGYPLPEVLIQCAPTEGFDATGWRPTGTTLTSTIGEGDRLDIGSRSFVVLHLPGHTRGSIGLWDEASGTLFSGDAVYAEEPLIDTAPTSDIPAYLATMRRLLGVPASVVHPGHDYSFGRDVLTRVAQRYLERRGGSHG